MATTKAAGGKGEDTRRAIVRVALEQAMELGLEGISLGGLSERIGMSKSGLFAHFKSKEALQLAVLEEAIMIFSERVVAPALAKPRGEPRLRALFQGKLAWIEENGFGRGCFFAALEQEYDDRPGPIRDRVVQSQRDWYETLVRAAALAVREGDLAKDVDPEQVAFELEGIDASYRHLHKLLDDRSAKKRAGAAYDRLIASFGKTRKS